MNNYVNSVMVMCTYSCQLTCSYCNVKLRNDRMPESVLRQAIGLLLTTRSKECVLRFWGGEPLLAWDLIKKGIEWGEEEARLKGKIIRFMITTNGLLLDEEKIKFLKKHQVKIMFSCDGDQAANCAHRISKNKRENADKLLGNLKLLIRSGLPYFVHMIVAPSAIKGLRKNLAFFKRLNVSKVQLCYQDAVFWPQEKQKALIDELEKFIRSGEHYDFLMNFVNDCEPTILGHEILIDVDGKVYYDGAIFMEKKFPRLRQTCFINNASNIKSIDSLCLPRHDFYPLFDKACSKAQRRVFQNNIGLGLKLDKLFNSYSYRHQSLNSNEHPLLIPIIKSDFNSQKKVLGKLGIDSLFLYLETPCMNNCIFCRHKDSSIVSDLFKAGLKLKENSRIRAGKLCIIGNDPLLYPYILEIVSLAKRSGFKKIEIMTSAERLSDKEFCSQLVGKGVSSFSLPLFASRARVHDKIVGNKGSFRKVMRGIRNATGLGAKVFIHTNLIKQNLGCMSELEDLVRGELRQPFAILPIRPKTANLPFGQLMPSYGEMIDNLRGADSLLLFPLCVVNRMKKGVFKAGKNEISDSMKLYVLDQRFLKPPVCKDCLYYAGCPGLFKEYAQLYGLDEIKPFKK